MIQIYKKLPLVVEPQSKSRLSSWINKIAIANDIHFDFFIHYIQIFENEGINIIQVLHNITRISKKKIEMKRNDIKNFPWDLNRKCIIKNCNFKGYKGYSRTHNAYRHKLGVKWLHCVFIECNYKTYHSNHLRIHMADKHDIKVKWYCTHKNKIHK